MKKFIKKIEDFICENCGAKIKGSGFTNHCSKCLYSKHVDINPGDRLEKCGGLMKPISATKEGEEWSLIHECLKCSFQKKNRISKEDNFDVVIKIGSNKI